MKTARLKNQYPKPKIPDHRYKILIAGCFGLGKKNALLNLTLLYPKDTYERKYQLLISKQ